MNAAGAGVRVGLWLRLASRFGRTRPVRRSAAVVAVCTAVLMLVLIGLSEFSLTSAHRAERDLGRFGAQVQLADQVGLRGDPRVVTAAVAAARSAGGRDVTVQIAGYDVRVDTAPRSGAVFYEMAWTADPFPRRWTLRSGVWPTRPGQVVLTAALAAATHHARVVPVLSGLGRFRSWPTVTRPGRRRCSPPRGPGMAFRGRRWR